MEKTPLYTVLGIWISKAGTCYNLFVTEMKEKLEPFAIEVLNITKLEEKLAGNMEAVKSCQTKWWDQFKRHFWNQKSNPSKLNQSPKKVQKMSGDMIATWDVLLLIEKLQENYQAGQKFHQDFVISWTRDFGSVSTTKTSRALKILNNLIALVSKKTS